jgi:hypothetical protein
MTLTSDEAVEYLLGLAPDLDPRTAEALPELFEDALDAGAALEVLDSGTSVSIRWIVAGSWTPLLLVYAGKWDCIEVNGRRSGRVERVTAAAERALNRALPPYGGSPGGRPSYELAALQLPDSRLAVREAFEEIGAAALDSMRADEGELPRRLWTVEELAALRGNLHRDLIAVLDRLAAESPNKSSMAELGEPLGRSGRGVSALLGTLSGQVRSRFGRTNWPCHGEPAPGGWLYWMETEQARDWTAAATGSPNPPGARYPTLEEVNEVLHVSGLWSSYGTVGEVMGRPGAARAIANENWAHGRGRIARQSGITESSDGEREQAWRAAHPDEVAVHLAFGYQLDKPWPREWYADASEIRMLLQLQPPSRLLITKLNDRLGALEAVGASHADGVVQQAAVELRALVRALT